MSKSKILDSELETNTAVIKSVVRDFLNLSNKPGNMLHSLTNNEVSVAKSHLFNTPSSAAAASRRMPTPKEEVENEDDQHAQETLGIN